tara:strand:- start:4006 stop:4242 length:237 start_codon:yes stop_codon:yes gene_type:complete
MKAETKKILILAGIGVLAYMIFFRKSATDTIDVDSVEIEDEPIEDTDALDEADESKESGFSNAKGFDPRKFARNSTKF